MDDTHDTTETPKMTRAQRKALRDADIAEHPEMYTNGKLVRRKRRWGKKRWVVHELDDGGNETGEGIEYATVREIAEARDLCYDTLRHVLSKNGAGDRAGNEIKARRYRCFTVRKIA